LEPETLFDQLCRPETLERAWKHVRAHYTAAAIPNEIAQFERHAPHRLDTLAQALREETFVPEPAALIEIRKPAKPGETRPISLHPPEDRVVLTALHFLLTPLFDPLLPPQVFGYRPGRGAIQAIECAAECLARGLTHAATADIDNFFDSLDRRLLLERLRQQIDDARILALLELYLHMGRQRRLEWVDTGRGVSQGSPLSPLLSNVYLLPFDRFLASLGLEWVRYADNILLLGADAESLSSALESVERHLAGEHRLALNPDSKCVASCEDGFQFLGFWFQGGRRTIHPDKVAQMQSKIAGLLHPGGRPLREKIAELRESILGWRRYYRSEQTGPQLQALQSFLFDRLLQEFLRLRQNKQLPPRDELRRLLFQLELPFITEGREKKAWIELLLNRTARDPLPSEPRPKESSQAEPRTKGTVPPEPRPSARGQAEPRPKRAIPPATPSPSQRTRHAVESRRRQLLQRKFPLQEVLVTSHGAFLGRSGQRLILREQSKKQAEIPLSMIHHVTILAESGSLSIDLLRAAAERNIRVHLLGWDGRPLSEIGPPESPAFDLSLAQSHLSVSRRCLPLARCFVLGKIRNQINLLRYRAKYIRHAAGLHADGTPNGGTESDGTPTMGEGSPPSRLETTQAAIAEMEAIFERAAAAPFPESEPMETLRLRLMSWEGQAAGAYWKAFRTLLAPRIAFDKRERRGAVDLVNVALNYGYAILYSRSLGILARHGLNPAIGFLHKPQPGKMTLAFDFMEEFRPAAVDRVVFALFGRRRPLAVGENGLDDASRALLSRAVLNRLRSETTYQGATVTLLEAMDFQARLLVKHIRGLATYKPWTMPW
jgi:group II intron reverse transcriptase/maturase